MKEMDRKMETDFFKEEPIRRVVFPISAPAKDKRVGLNMIKVLKKIPLGEYSCKHSVYSY